MTSKRSTYHRRIPNKIKKNSWSTRTKVCELPGRIKRSWSGWFDTWYCLLHNLIYNFYNIECWLWMKKWAHNANLSQNNSPCAYSRVFMFPKQILQAHNPNALLISFHEFSGREHKLFCRTWWIWLRPPQLFTRTPIFHLSACHDQILQWSFENNDTQLMNKSTNQRVQLKSA